MVERNLSGWIPSKPDDRDLKYKLKLLIGLPNAVDLSEKMVPVIDQLNLGSCTACAATGALGYLYNQVFSRLFIYYNTRVIEHTVAEDAGAENRDTVKAIAKNGACLEKLWKYDVSKFTTKPSPTCYTNAKKYRISSYTRLQSILEIKDALANGSPVIIGVTVFDGFVSDKVAKTGDVYMPTRRENECGGHAILVSGYDDTKQRFIFRNSWGTEWGNKGYGTIPYNYVIKYGDDFWIISK